MKNTPKKNQIIPIINKKKKKLSKLESLFNYRIRRVKRLKDRLDLASEQLINYHKERTDRVFPVAEETVIQQVNLIRALIEAFDAKVLIGRKQREKFEKIILFFIEDLVFNKEQKGLEDIYERFAKKTIQDAEEEIIEEEKEQFFRMMDFMGVKLEEEEKQKILEGEMDSDFMDSLEEKLSEENLNDTFFKSFGGFREPKKSKKQIEKEEREAEELVNISKTVKKVYKELIIELHPDKELDEDKRLEKTVLIQEVTEAYRNDDLFTLLSIQLEQITEKDNRKLTNEKIDYFNTMLLSQARELEAQIQGLGHKAELKPILTQNLGKKEFNNLLNEYFDEEQLEAEVILKNVKEHLGKVKAKDKNFIKDFVEENHKQIFESSPLPFFFFDDE